MIEFTCPHCNGIFVVSEKELNCRIIRHFVYFNGEQLNPHAPKELCEGVILNKQGYGCAKPARLVQKEDGEWKAEICEYI